MWAICRENKNRCSQKWGNNSQIIRPTWNGSVTVPYNAGLSETFKNLCKRYGIEVHIKSAKTIKDELVAPKVKIIHQTKWCNLQIQMKCWNAMNNYIGETVEHLFKEHLKAPSHYSCIATSGHSTTLKLQDSGQGWSIASPD